MESWSSPGLVLMGAMSILLSALRAIARSGGARGLHRPPNILLLRDFCAPLESFLMYSRGVIGVGRASWV
ncbi:hypothetical protein L208DRAFT_1405760 [Tricholoma matsutake]|nr:hypothetical protein L208DRAFT_1405760 [Tricholoma matsutake 945]